MLELIWHAPSARHNALFSLKALWVSINNAKLYCYLNEIITRFEFREPWRIYVDLICPRDLNSLNINFIIN